MIELGSGLRFYLSSRLKKRDAGVCKRTETGDASNARRKEDLVSFPSYNE